MHTNDYWKQIMQADADYAIDRLLSRGYLYDIDSQLFVTEDEDFERIE